MIPENKDLKAQFRTAAGTRRRWAQADTGPEAGVLLAERFIKAIPLDAHAVVAGYWPMDTEIDTRPLLRRLVQMDHPVALPVVVAPGRPLKFRQWTPEVRMQPGPYGIDVPPDEAEEMDPEVIVVPLLAFDRPGWRLGYGGGFYDRTLRRLRGLDQVLAVGVGYAAQRLETVPHDDLDEPLDWIVTEEYAVEVGE
jgi:5-formyltetrahydrofolate cyclo-ligase